MEFIEVKGERAATPFCRAVAESLSETPKRLPTRYLYDQMGSELFEQITELPEYYPTRTERAILDRYSAEIIESAGPNLALVEFGSGSSSKTRLLIEAALARQPALTYVPIDISIDFLKQTSQELLDRYEGLKVRAIGGEYFDAVAAIPPHDGPRLILFMGGNIGNLTREEAVDFLGRIRSQMMPDDRLLVGIDLVKDRSVIEAAYNDAQGVTAAFNRNLLRRVNRELEGNFSVDCFRHHAPYDEVANRIEMRLYSLREQHVALEAVGKTFDFREGEYIHTEWSHKYTRASFASICIPAGFEIDAFWQDEREWFGLTLLRPTSHHPV